ncbi:hypothetical protein FOCC_FOCC000206 [Frankliniella occidentalis]|nr:hypothetical protein FOCC_FOCC000206 [Frankliniella occidentalis]
MGFGLRIDLLGGNAQWCLPWDSNGASKHSTQLQYNVKPCRPRHLLKRGEAEIGFVFGFGVGTIAKMSICLT